MDTERKQQEALKALKAFNNAVTTCRLYPATSPQVANAVEKAYQSIKSFSRAIGQLSFGKSEQGPVVCGFPVSEQIGGEIKDLVVYRHLDLLKLEHVMLRPNFDRQIFNAILTVFTARKEKIDREGGGRPFVDSLGLQHYFPDDSPPPEYQAAGRDQDTELSLPDVDVPPEILDHLFGGTESRPQTFPPQARKHFQQQDTAVDLVVAGMVRTLQELTKRTAIPLSTRSTAYTRFLTKIDGLLAAERHAEIAAGAASAIIGVGSATIMARLYCQHYPDGFGRQLFRALIELAANELFDAAMMQLRDVLDGSTAREGDLDDEIVAATIQSLLETQKGKLHLGRERVRDLIGTGEQDRRNKRIEAGISALLRGNHASLKSEELLLCLPEEIEKRYRLGNVEDGARLIEVMAAEMLGGDDELRRRLIRSLVMVGGLFLDRERWEPLERLTGPLISWIRESDEGDSVFEKSAFLLQAIMGHACERENFDRVDQILTIFHKIRTGQLQKPPPIPALIGRIQDRSHNRPLFKLLLRRYLDNGAETKDGERLSMMGRPAGSFLIDTLLQEEEPKDRLRIIDLLANMGPVIVAVALEKLPEPMPWFGKRNLIKLATQVAGPEQVADIMPFLRHEDLRVQREAFVCIYTISKERRKQALLASLQAASEGLLVQIVKALHRFADAETAEHLAVMLADQEHYSESIRAPLVREIIEILSRTPTVVAQTALQRFLHDRDKKTNRKLESQLWRDAENALKAINAELKKSEPLTADEKISRSGSGQQPTARPAKGSKPESGLAEVAGVEKVRELLAQGKQELARESILKLITRAVGNHRFQEAEALREWLIEIDPMALTEIIRAAELIEEEKISSIDKDQIEAWSDLYDVLTTEEFATFFHAMRRTTYENEQFIVRQGDLQSGLYFITSGKVKISYRDKAGEVLVKTAVRGEILGADTVFEASVWTVNVACLVRTEALYLDIDTLLKWRDDYPALESKLQDFCMKSASLQPFLKAGGKDRRAAKRQRLSGRVSSLLLDSKGRETGIASKGELFDISTGGVSFFLRISQKKNARLLLGRGTRVVLPMDGAVDRQKAILGTIIAIRGHQAMENEYSVHVKFVDEISLGDLQAIIKTGRESGLS